MPSKEEQIKAFLKKLSEIVQKISEYFTVYASQTAENTPRINEKPMNEVKPLPPKSRLTDLCLAMKEFEGWGGPGSTINGTYYPNGTPSYRHNNPGNCKYSSVGYAATYGHVGKSTSGFAIFKDYATGFLYMQNLIKEKIKKNPYWTLYDLIFAWAPPQDHNNPTRYSAYVAKRLGVTPDYPVSQLL